MVRLLEIGLSNAAMATVLALLAAGLCRLYRRPAFAHGLWLVVLLKLVTPPLVPVPLPWFGAPQPPEPGADSTEVDAPAEPDTAPRADVPDADSARVPPSQAGIDAFIPEDRAAAQEAESGFLPNSWCVAVFLVWLGGSLFGLAWSARSVLCLQRLLRFARKADPSLQALVNELAGKLNLARRPQLWLVPGKISPLLWTLGFQPRILFPAQLLKRLTREQLRTILLHELAHWGRRDHWVRFLELTVLILYWWHPAVWWVRSQLRAAEEECCDAWVVGTLERADRTYALALLETVAFFSKVRLPLPVAATGIGHVSQLRRRLTMIMSEPKRRSLTWAGAAGLLAFGLLFLPLGPVGAEAAKKEGRKVTFVIGNGSLQIVQGAEESPEQKALQLLKQARKILAEQKQARPTGTAKRPDPEKLREAHRLMDALAAQVAKQRRELQLAEAQLRRFRARLAQVEGKPGFRISGPLQLQFKIQPNKDTPKPKVTGPKGRTIVFPKQLLLRVQDGKIIGFSGKKETRVQPPDIKARLDRLLREVEALRREVERTAPPRK